MNICIYGAASDNINPEFLLEGEKLGKYLAERSHTIVFGGGAEGMMGAVARGSNSVGGKLIGISPTFFKVDGVLYDKCTDFIYTETMRERKQILEESSDAFIVTPGGIGTLDEFFEIYSLRQLRRHKKAIVLYNIRGFFNPLIKMLETCADEKFMKAANLKLFAVASTPKEALEFLENYREADEQISDFR